MRRAVAYHDILQVAARAAADHLDGIAGRPVGADVGADHSRRLYAELGGPLPADGEDPVAVLETLAGCAPRGAVASAGPRYFGYVAGGALPVTVAAAWLVAAWDQVAALYDGGPAVAVVEREHVHMSVLGALRLLGFGRAEVVRVAADAQGRIRPDALEAAPAACDGGALICAQAGEINTGAFDPLAEIGELARAGGHWLHVDGAFGLWAAAAPSLAHLTAGLEFADSCATDFHKVGNTPYDCGIVLCAPGGPPRRDGHRGALHHRRRRAAGARAAQRNRVRAGDLRARARRAGVGHAAVARSRRSGRPGDALRHQRGSGGRRRSTTRLASRSSTRNTSLRVHVSYCPDAEAGAALADGRIDAALMWANPCEPELVGHRLLEDPPMLLVPADSPLARRGTPPSAAELGAIALIGRRGAADSEPVLGHLSSSCGNGAGSPGCRERRRPASAGVTSADCDSSLSSRAK